MMFIGTYGTCTPHACDNRLLCCCCIVPCCCRETTLGSAFFGSVATPRTVKNILCQAYADDSAVTDELVDAILKPGLQVRRGCTVRCAVLRCSTALCCAFQLRCAALFNCAVLRCAALFNCAVLRCAVQQ